MRLAELITRKLTEAFAPESVRVIDESHQHEGHAGHRPEARAISAYILYRRRSGGRATWSATAMINAVLAAELHGGARTCNPTPRSWRRACLIRILTRTGV